MSDFKTRVTETLYPKGVEHPNQAEPDALINAIRQLQRDHDAWKNKYLMKISEPVRHD